VQAAARIAAAEKAAAKQVDRAAEETKKAEEVSAKAAALRTEKAEAARALKAKKEVERIRSDAAKSLSGALRNLTAKKLDHVPMDEADEMIETCRAVLAHALELKVDWDRIVSARTTISAAEERTQERKRDAVRELLREDLVLLDMYASGTGAKTLVEQVYRRHPPARRTVSEQEIERAKTDAQWKKVLLKAQRDYHPDRNQGRDCVPTFTSSGALKYSVLEWEMLSNSICQQLTLKYDSLFKVMESCFEEE